MDIAANRSLTITIEEPALVSKYAFGTGTARFHICGPRGVVTVVTSETDGRLYAVVNVNTFNDSSFVSGRKTARITSATSPSAARLANPAESAALGCPGPAARGRFAAGRHEGTHRFLPGLSVGGDAASGLAGSAQRACHAKVIPAV